MAVNVDIVHREWLWTCTGKKYSVAVKFTIHEPYFLRRRLFGRNKLGNEHADEKKMAGDVTKRPRTTSGSFSSEYEYEIRIQYAKRMLYAYAIPHWRENVVAVAHLSSPS
jgi:hypothetical protein